MKTSFLKNTHTLYCFALGMSRALKIFAEAFFVLHLKEICVTIYTGNTDVLKGEDFDMNMQTEKVFIEFNKFIEEKGAKPKNEAEAQNLFYEFMERYHPEASGGLTEETAKTSYDFMELCESALKPEDALKYAKKALKLDPDNIDAASHIACLTAASDEKLADKYKKLIAEAEEKYEAKGWFDKENIGHFWLITETRPYMRLLCDYAELLTDCGMMRLAAEVYKKMLKLCTGDNLGARYRLMHIYAFLEEKQAADELSEAYSEEGAFMLLPYSILYYKMGELRTAWRHLKKIYDTNSDTYKFFKSASEGKVGELIEQTDMSIGYRPYTMEEFLTASGENTFLYIVSTSYFVWAWEKIKDEKKKKK